MEGQKFCERLVALFSVPQRTDSSTLLEWIKVYRDEFFESRFLVCFKGLFFQLRFFALNLIEFWLIFTKRVFVCNKNRKNSFQRHTFGNLKQINWELWADSIWDTCLGSIFARLEFIVNKGLRSLYSSSYNNVASGGCLFSNWVSIREDQKSWKKSVESDRKTSNFAILHKVNSPKKLQNAIPLQAIFLSALLFGLIITADPGPCWYGK